MAISNVQGQAVQTAAQRTKLEPSWTSAVLSVTCKWFQPKTPIEMAQAELAEAQRSRLQALSAAEYAEAMALYHAKRIDRLTAFLESTPINHRH
jgi:hypothetical protein